MVSWSCDIVVSEERGSARVFGSWRPPKDVNKTLTVCEAMTRV
jgi:hypothetical protein